jgi:hypothetical protein
MAVEDHEVEGVLDHLASEKDHRSVRSPEQEKWTLQEITTRGTSLPQFTQEFVPTAFCSISWPPQVRGQRMSVRVSKRYFSFAPAGGFMMDATRSRDSAMAREEKEGSMKRFIGHVTGSQENQTTAETLALEHDATVVVVQSNAYPEWLSRPSHLILDLGTFSDANKVRVVSDLLSLPRRAVVAVYGGRLSQLEARQLHRRGIIVEDSLGQQLFARLEHHQKAI